MRKFVAGIISVFFITLFTIVVFAEENPVKGIELTQVHVAEDTIRVYMDFVTDVNSMEEVVNEENIQAVLGGKKLPLTSLQQIDDSEEPVTYLCLIDISKSLDLDQESKIKNTLSGIMHNLKSKDHAAMMTFGETTEVIMDFTNDETKIKDTIESITIKDNSTNLYKGVNNAIELLANRDTETSKKVLIILSDGVEAHYKGYTLDEVYLKIKENPMPIYTIGFYNNNTTEEKKESLKILGSLARRSKGKEYLQGSNDLNEEEVAISINENINKSYVAIFESSQVKADGSEYYLEIKVDNSTGDSIRNGLAIRMPNVAEEKDIPSENIDEGNDETEDSEDEKNKDMSEDIATTNTSDNEGEGPTKAKYLFVVGIIAFILVLIIIFLLIKKAKKKKLVIISEDVENEEAGEVNDDNITVFDRTRPIESSSQPIVEKNGIQLRLVKMGKKSKETSYSIYLIDRFVIGRNPNGTDLTFKDDIRLSSKHCELVINNNDIYINDLDSTNGTFVNGVPIKGYYNLKHDDILLIGSMELRVCIG